MSEFLKFEDIKYSEDSEFFHKLTTLGENVVGSLLYNKIFNKCYNIRYRICVNSNTYKDILGYFHLFSELGYYKLYSEYSDNLEPNKLRMCAYALVDKTVCSILVLDYNYGPYALCVYSNDTVTGIIEHLKPIIEYSDNLKQKDAKITKFYQISQTQSGFEKIQLNLNKISFNKNHYNNLDLDNLIEIINSNKPGVIVFNGVPGSGKTSLIKHLTSVIDKEFINISGDMLEIFNSPQFQRFIVSELKDSVIILEDCEKLIKSRNISNSNISTLLNLGDGLLGSALNIKVILTYNTKDTNVDPALLRKGRTLFKHEFATLSAEKATEISKEIGKNNVYTTDVALTEIFNAEAQDFSETTERKKIGF